MPLQQTVTIVNNSGKIISSGKKLLSILKEAKGAYDDKKAELQSVKRAETMDCRRSITASGHRGDKYETESAVSTVRRQRRRRHEHQHHQALTGSKASVGVKDNIDMDLAYGNVPPDLAWRTDLDPKSGDDAKRLVGRVEALLDEAHCLQHSAGAMIRQLQEQPEAAAEVALTLADLSSAVAKMSPAVVGILKSGSPAVFALLASPQFLIGTSIAVGVTVVMFGGWKIVKRVHEGVGLLPGGGGGGGGATRRMTDGEVEEGVEEALVVDDDEDGGLGGSIERWRRGIVEERADVELITPRAKDHDVRSRRSGKSSRRGGEKTMKEPERKMDMVMAGDARSSGRSSGRGSGRGSSRTRRTAPSVDNRMEVVLRPKPARQGDNMLKAVMPGRKGREMVLA
ncbi:hypothetical protein GQ602_001306 [Ophiocordyceps camponoti-floridani]|uniref:Uncharacterized protein n=1 Tax=Ophiocordyceps camponoti-floridani TaxID=2030778 RepID=A0A8H4VH37_9HYPO|nr:hypothetical protein GQ602_001306 [Ophiocordyceps camponoti-floridani]